MRQLLIIFFISIIIPLTLANPQAVEGEQPRADIHLLESKVDLGEFSRDSAVSRKVKFVNTGDAPLIIKSAFSNCGCTVADYPHEEIAPGDTAALTVTYKSIDKLGGHFRKIVRIRSNARTPLLSIYISGIVL